MIKKLFFNLKWRLFQKLSLLPSKRQSSISDLFLWRVDKDWDTYFDLVSVPNLINPNGKSKLTYVKIYIFNSIGNLIVERKIELLALRKVLLNIRDLLGEVQGYGTFAVFHDTSCADLHLNKSYIAERGYLSFAYKHSTVRSYVHGNYDALALVDDKKIEFLGNKFIWKRKYNLQYIFSLEKKHEVILIGTCKRPIKYEVQLIDLATGELIDRKKFSLSTATVFIYKVLQKSAKLGRVVILSHSIMARPLVLNYQNQGVNIFHG